MKPRTLPLAIFDVIILTSVRVTENREAGARKPEVPAPHPRFTDARRLMRKID
jgi:hypothetical protein